MKWLTVSNSLRVHGWRSLRGFSVHELFQARVLDWVTISFSRGYSQPRNQTRVSRIVGRRFTIWATREVQNTGVGCLSLLQGIISTQANSSPTELSRKPSSPGGSDSISVCLHCGRPGFNPWVGKIPWRRKCQPTPVLLPGKFHGSQAPNFSEPRIIGVIWLIGKDLILSPVFLSSSIQVHLRCSFPLIIFFLVQSQSIWLSQDTYLEVIEKNQHLWETGLKLNKLITLIYYHFRSWLCTTEQA